MELITTTVGAITGGGAAAGGGISAMSIIQGGLSVFGVMARIAQASADADAMEDQAAAKEVEETGEEARKMQNQAAMKRELARLSGENDVSFAAAGIDISHGVAADTRSSEAKKAANQLTIDRADADKRKAMLRMQAAGLRSRASARRSGALYTGIGQLANTSFKIARRG